VADRDTLGERDCSLPAVAGRAHSRGSAADDENRIHVATLAPTAWFRLVETARDKVAHLYARWHELELLQTVRLPRQLVRRNYKR
jgi:hypothetical protein